MRPELSALDADVRNTGAQMFKLKTAAGDVRDTDEYAQMCICEAVSSETEVRMRRCVSEPRPCGAADVKDRRAQVFQRWDQCGAVTSERRAHAQERDDELRMRQPGGGKTTSTMIL
ncbi:hypothetical protein NDU88_011973 [Pleurodeles waltl]|uniref:Uncharacterized protein n=1 Tax=Pleurodeles waltl TaxID=8319 RepID=A0AAV7S2S0_PLEWA|nr:hypothetical protein NDU88_011973 [Pleurodeles waltl]